MPGVCLYFQVHQPYRLKRYTVFQIDHDHTYEDDASNLAILNKVADKCYLPANQVIFNLIQKYQGAFKVAFSITGLALEQFEKHRPDVMASFRRLADTGCVEFLNETYYHSLAFLYSREEFVRQVEMHKGKIRALFGQEPTSFRHTELIYNNDLSKVIEEMGYRAILTEGANKILGWRSANYTYRPPGCKNLVCLLRNYPLSDDIGFRFSNQTWPEFPLTADKFAHWIHKINGEGDIVNIFIDYETFGEHQWRETGIFDFLAALPGEILKHPYFQFYTPAEAASLTVPIAELNVPEFISWADTERDISAWQGNAMQKDAARNLYALEADALKANPEILNHWRRLQTSDHFYYMCTKWFADGTVHKYFNPYVSPYDAYINYMNILDDLSRFLLSECR